MLTNFRWNSGLRSKSSLIALGLVIFCGTMIFAGNSLAGGSGGGPNDIHLTITIAEGSQSVAILVGLAILIGVYVLIITEVVHRTLAAAIGGFLAMMALNYYSQEDVLNISCCLNDRLGNYWSIVRYDGYGWCYVSHWDF